MVNFIHGTCSSKGFVFVGVTQKTKVFKDGVSKNHYLHIVFGDILDLFPIGFYNEMFMAARHATRNLEAKQAVDW